DALARFFDTGQRRGGFERGIELAIERMLVDPNFLFRIEHDPPNAAAGDVFSVTDLELASRLSFFLWSSIPDEALLAAAESGHLHEPPTLNREVRRMLGDRHSRALVENFASEWLSLRRLRDVSPDPVLFPEFDGNLRDAFARETELLIESTLREDRPITDLLTSDYTFVNERLADHYG